MIKIYLLVYLQIHLPHKIFQVFHKFKQPKIQTKILVILLEEEVEDQLEILEIITTQEQIIEAFNNKVKNKN